MRQREGYKTIVFADSFFSLQPKMNVIKDKEEEVSHSFFYFMETSDALISFDLDRQL